MVSGDEQAYADPATHVPIGRAGRPGEIAAAVLWLCSPGASYVIGKELTVDEEGRVRTVCCDGHLSGVWFDRLDASANAQPGHGEPLHLVCRDDGQVRGGRAMDTDQAERSRARNVTRPASATTASVIVSGAGK